MVEEGGFEPPKSVTTDLQSAPFGRSGTPPYEIGAGGRIRTPDLLITNQLLYRLSYTSKFGPTAESILTDKKYFVNTFFAFRGGKFLQASLCRRRRQTVLCCTLCGREITRGEEYWACNGSSVCADCLGTFARQELACCREIRGKERNYDPDGTICLI